MTISIVSPHLAALPALLDVRAVAALFGVSTRTVFRQSEAGRMPPPLKIGRAVRWRNSDLQIWIDAGCPVVEGGT